MNASEQPLIKTDIVIKFDDRKQYLCYLDEALGKTYYKVIDEYIFINDSNKAAEVKEWVKKQAYNKRLKQIVPAVAGVVAVSAGLLYFLTRKK